MPIVYRDCRDPRPTVFRMPPGFPAGHACQRTEADGGDLVGIWDPMIFQVSNIPADAVWHQLSDHWKVCQIGPLEPRTLLRADAGRPDLIPITDSLGRGWHVPAVLNPLGKVALTLPIGRNEVGQWARLPSAEQSALIAAATFVRQEVEATETVRVPNESGDGTTEAQVSRFSRMPLAAAADTLATLLASVYLLAPETCAALCLFDDRLAQDGLLYAAGFRPKG